MLLAGNENICNIIKKIKLSTVQINEHKLLEQEGCVYLTKVTS